MSDTHNAKVPEGVTLIDGHLLDVTIDEPQFSCLCLCSKCSGTDPISGGPGRCICPDCCCDKTWMEDV